MTAVSVLPVSVANGVLIVIVIHGPSLDRIKAQDPAMVPIEALRPVLKSHACRHLHDAAILVCYEEDEEEFTQKALSFAGDTPGLLAWLKRGWTDKPGDGLPPFVISHMDGGGPVH